MTFSAESIGVTLTTAASLAFFVAAMKRKDVSPGTRLIAAGLFFGVAGRFVAWLF